MEGKVIASAAAHVAPRDALDGKRFYRSREASAFLAERFGLHVSVPALDTRVTRGGGPPYRKWGKFRVYEEGDLIAWVAVRLGAPLGSSSEAA
jgi:hypothetical protein